MGAGHSWPGGIATGRGDFSGETLCSTQPAYQRGFSGPTGDRSRRTPHVARVVLTARLGENVVPKRFGVFISTSIIATYIFEVLKTSQNELTSRQGTNAWGCRSRSVLKLAGCLESLSKTQICLERG